MHSQQMLRFRQQLEMLWGQVLGLVLLTMHTIVPTDGETHTINGTSYPVMGKLYVPVGLTDNQIDVVVVFHGTLRRW